uniref:Headcase N-terminal domain-containing protein n=1 Tax=Caenorhabditis japonica TaxID=281687 RepID=A0A8R1DFQ1_CAEJA
MPRVQRRIEIGRRSIGGGVSKVSSSEDVIEEIPKINGCPVFDPIYCQCPKMPIDEADGVKMACTSEPCPFARIPLHKQCYQMLEEHLVKRLGTLGSARGWTVPQRRNNLWEKKGQALIGRFCRCRCGHGQMTRDKQALYEKEKAVEKEKKRKAKKAKQLPQLHFNSKPSAAAAANEGKKRETESVSSVHPTNSRTISTSRSRLHTERSTMSTRTIALFESMSESSINGNSTGRYSNNVFLPSDCEDDFDDEDDSSDRVVPAPPPPPQMKSYAATIKHDSQLRDDFSNVCDEVASAKTLALNSPDSGLYHSTPRLSTSPDAFSHEEHGLGDFSVQEGLNPLGLSILSSVEPDSPQEVFLPEITSTPQLPRKCAKLDENQNSISHPSTSEENRCGIRFTAPVRAIMDMWTATHSSFMTTGDLEPMSCESEEDIKKGINYGWTPMFGRGFNLGERLKYIP